MGGIQGEEMTEELLQYQTLVENALRSVVREALSEVAMHGLPGEHHFYITFDTRAQGVEMPAYLRETYPDEMTLVLQHQFSNLAVSDDHFQVILSFNGRPEVIRVPLEAISIFADPSVNFALQFQNFAQVPDDDLPPADDAGEGGAEVISLDQFRKHK